MVGSVEEKRIPYLRPKLSVMTQKELRAGWEVGEMLPQMENAPLSPPVPGVGDTSPGRC